MDKSIILIENAKVNTKDFISCVKKESNVIAYNNGIEIASFPYDNDISEIFRYRDTCKAVVIQKENSNAIIRFTKFADLHRHSGYSMLDGAISISSMVDKTSYAGALTDHGNMHGCIDYYKKMLKENKKPILGFEAYIKDYKGEDKKYSHLLLLAKNNTGFKNLIQLTSLSYGDMFNGKPRINYDLLKEYSEGIIASSACLGGNIPKLLSDNKIEKAYELAKLMIDIFGTDDFYIEIQRHGIEGENEINELLLKMAKDLNLKIIATTDSHYVNKEDAFEHEILLCIGTQKTIDEEHYKFSGTGYHLHSDKEIEELFKDLPEALDNTLEIAEKCTVDLDLETIHMPEFKVPLPFKDEVSYFEHLVHEGFRKRFAGTEKDNEEYRERLEFEINVVKQMNYCGYFLIVWDFVNYAKENGILVGPGRGSGAGSLILYCLSITEIDPIPFGLLFERFLNPDRISMPDIDLDFDDNRRDEVIEYVKRKYGESSVSRIITFGTLSARAVIRDVARALGFPYSLGDRISKSIPEEPDITLNKAMEKSPEFCKLLEEDDVKKIVDIALKLEGLPRQTSIHACGVIIAPTKVTDYIPQLLMEDDKTKKWLPTTQINMNECEDLGLLKMDFLGLRTMGVVNRSLADINKKRLKEGKTQLNYHDIPIDDPLVYDFLSKGNTDGVFQLESPGMTNFIKELFQDAYKYTHLTGKEAKIKGMEFFERLIAGISLYRPGPIDEIPNYIHNMTNPEDVTYDTEQLEPILNTTYGILIYQEQVMFAVRVLAGFSKGQSDEIRKAMGKKKEHIVNEYEEYFIYGSDEYDKKNPNKKLNIKGCIKNGITKEAAIIIWDKMRKFCRYAFNKSHATCYADISIRTAWLAYYYPEEFMCATLNSFIHKADKIKRYMSTCKKKNINILPPNVNLSKELFTVYDDSIRFGLMGIKNMGKASIDIISERNERGIFKDFQDFAERMAIYKKIDKKILEALIYSSSVDIFEGTRKSKLEILPTILGSAKFEKELHYSDQMSLFSTEAALDVYKKVEIPNTQEFEQNYMLKMEKEYAGFYITSHPLDKYPKLTNSKKVTELVKLLPQDREDDEIEGDKIEANLYDGKNVRVFGVMKNIENKYTKKDSKLLKIFELEDKTGEIKCVAFSRCIDIYIDCFGEDSIVFILGKVKVDDFGAQIIVEKVQSYA